MLLPIKANFALPRFPVLTLLICLVCVGVFLKQQSDWRDYEMGIVKFCNAERSHIDQMIFNRIAAAGDTNNCMDILYTITNDPARDEADIIAEMASSIKPLSAFSREDSVLYVTGVLEEEVRRFRARVQDEPEAGYVYYTGSWNPLTMISSSFAHGDWFHIIFNLIFFFAFAATVEVLIGPLRYLAFVIADAFFIGVTGSLAAAAAGQHYTTLGLSGIVMGMMGLFAYLLPRAKIKCLYFVVVIFGFIAIPGWMLAAWYIGGDIFRLFAYDDHGIVNVMAHVMGGLGGYLFGVAFLSDIRRDAVHLQDDLDRAAFDARFR